MLIKFQKANLWKRILLSNEDFDLTVALWVFGAVHVWIVYREIGGCVSATPRPGFIVPAFDSDMIRSFLELCALEAVRRRH